MYIRESGQENGPTIIFLHGKAQVVLCGKNI